ncbi:MAG: hypothetical protein ABI042_13120 [Verrucomicrobiota bacterium]
MSLNIDVRRSSRYSMNEDSITAEEADAQDNDPWTFFGSYSDGDIAAARSLLQQASIAFHVTGDAPPEASLMPHHLWVHDNHIEQAQSILVAYFQRNDRNAS